MLPKMLIMHGFDYMPFYAHHHGHFGDQAESTDTETNNPDMAAEYRQKLSAADSVKNVRSEE